MQWTCWLVSSYGTTTGFPCSLTMSTTWLHWVNQETIFPYHCVVRKVMCWGVCHCSEAVERVPSQSVGRTVRLSHHTDT